MFIPLGTAEHILKGNGPEIGRISQLRNHYIRLLLSVPQSLTPNLTLKPKVDPYGTLDTELINLDEQHTSSADPQKSQKQEDEICQQKLEIYIKYITKAIEKEQDIDSSLLQKRKSEQECNQMSKKICLPAKKDIV